MTRIQGAAPTPLQQCAYLVLVYCRWCYYEHAQTMTYYRYAFHTHDRVPTELLWFILWEITITPVRFGGAHVDLIHWTAMVKCIDSTFLMKCTVPCTTSLWSPDKAGNSTCFCKQDSEQNGVIVVISIQT